MAITTDLSTSNFGIAFNGAYFRIVTAAVTRQRNAQHSVMIDVAGYATVPQNDDTKEIDFRRYHTPLADIEGQAGASFLAKCYSLVMSQPDMQGCKAA